MTNWSLQEQSWAWVARARHRGGEYAAIRGIHTEQDGRLIVATDRHRLHAAIRPDALGPADGLWTAGMMLVAEPFPVWRKVIPEGEMRVWHVEDALGVRAICAGMEAAQERVGAFNGGALGFPGVAGPVHVQPLYLHDALAGFADGSALVCAGKPDQPLAVCDAELRHLAVIMPVRYKPKDKLILPLLNLEEMLKPATAPLDKPLTDFGWQLKPVAAAEAVR